MDNSSSAQAIASLYSQYGTADFEGNWVAQDWNFHDMVGYSAANKISFFTVPAGNNDPVLNVVKKREQSNLGTPNQIGGDYFFIIESIRLFVLNAAKTRQTANGSTASTDTNFAARQLAYVRLFESIMARGALRFQVNQKTILLENRPWDTFSAGFGLGEVTPPAVGTGGAAAINGGVNAYVSNSIYDIDEGAMGDPFAMGQPVVLAPSTTFNLDLEFPLGNTPTSANIYGASANQPATIWIGCWLVGQKVRARS